MAVNGKTRNARVRKNLSAEAFSSKGLDAGIVGRTQGIGQADPLHESAPSPRRRVFGLHPRTQVAS